MNKRVYAVTGYKHVVDNPDLYYMFMETMGLGEAKLGSPVTDIVVITYAVEYTPEVAEKHKAILIAAYEAQNCFSISVIDITEDSEYR